MKVPRKDDNYEALSSRGTKRRGDEEQTMTKTLPASVAQLDARPTGDQEVEDSNPAGSATLFRGDLTMKYFLRAFSPSR